MKIKLHTSLLQNIFIGIFVSVVSGLIIFFLTEQPQQTIPEMPNTVQHTDNAIYKMLQTEQQRLEFFSSRLAEKEQELLDVKQNEGFTRDFFDGAEASKIRQEIDFLEESIEQAEDKIIKFSHELDRISTRSQEQSYPIFSLVIAGLTFVSVVILLSLLSG